MLTIIYLPSPFSQDAIDDDPLVQDLNDLASLKSKSTKKAVKEEAAKKLQKASSKYKAPVDEDDDDDSVVTKSKKKTKSKATLKKQKAKEEEKKKQIEEDSDSDDDSDDTDSDSDSDDDGKKDKDSDSDSDSDSDDSSDDEDDDDDHETLINKLFNMVGFIHRPAMISFNAIDHSTFKYKFMQA